MSEKTLELNVCLLEIMYQLCEVDYISLPITSDSDAKLSEVMDSLLGLTRKEVDDIAGSIDQDVAGILGVYSERMAAMAVRENNIDFTYRSLLAFILYANSHHQDDRDSLVLLCVVVDCAKRLNQDPRLLFNKFFMDNNLGTFKLIADFLNRNPNDQTIEAMGYIASSDNNSDFIYRRTW